MAKKVNHFDVYVTRDTNQWYDVSIWPAELGIRKWHGCVQYGNAKDDTKCDFSGRSILSIEECKIQYGFIPKKECAYNVYTTPSGKIKIVKVNLEFSDYYTIAELKAGFITEIKSKDIDEKIRARALLGIKKLRRKDLNMELKPSLLEGFWWGGTSEGREFWKGIHDAPIKK